MKALLEHAKAVVEAFVPVDETLPDYLEQNGPGLADNAPAHMHMALSFCRSAVSSATKLIVRQAFVIPSNLAVSLVLHKLWTLLS